MTRITTITLCSVLFSTACGDKDDTTEPGGVATDADGDGFASDEDCDDSDGSVFPGADEVCDGIDNDCDGIADNELVSMVYTDADGDGFGDPLTAEAACEPSVDQVTNGEDCDDTDETINPDAAEACNAVDDNCNGAVDEDVVSTWYLDLDSDGFGDPDAAWNDCDPPPGYAAVDGDCDDSTAAVSPDADEVCDGIDNDCDTDIDEDVLLTFYVDADGDGYGSTDGTTEACEAPSGYSDNTDDCNDALADVNPGATELCNGMDDDCDTETDEADAADATLWYDDADTDGYGDPASSTVACDQPSGTVADDTDCDDSNASVNPDTVWYLDYDSDGYGGTRITATQCTQPSNYVSDSSDCDDLQATVNPAATEICNGEDDDCDGDIDFDDASLDASTTGTYYLDFDGDGYGDASSSTTDCEAPSGYVSDGTDCDDTDAAVSPAATEICNGEDDDCDGDIDFDDASLDASTTGTYYVDGDGDGYGDASSSTTDCEAPSGYVSDDTDCDDGDATANPGEVEDCDGVDNNCDGDIDEGLVGADASCPAVSCDAVLADDPSAADGAYYLDPDGNGAFINYCDMTTDGGGWTLVFSCNADDASYGSGFDGWWEDGSTATLDDTTDRGKSIAYDEADVDEVRLTASYDAGSTIIFSTGTTLSSLHDIVGSEITTCSGIRGTGRYTYAASTYSGPFFQSSTVDVVVCDTDGDGLETTGDGNYDASIFSTYTNHGDYNDPDGTIGTEWTCAGSQYSMGVSSNNASVWVR